MVKERVRTATRAILAGYSGTTVVFTHGGPIRTLHSMLAVLPASPWTLVVPCGHILRFDISREALGPSQG